MLFDDVNADEVFLIWFFFLVIVSPVSSVLFDWLTTTCFLCGCVFHEQGVQWYADTADLLNLVVGNKSQKVKWWRNAAWWQYNDEAVEAYQPDLIINILFLNWFCFDQIQKQYDQVGVKRNWDVIPFAWFRYYLSSRFGMGWTIWLVCGEALVFVFERDDSLWWTFRLFFVFIFYSERLWWSFSQWSAHLPGGWKIRAWTAFGNSSLLRSVAAGSNIQTVMQRDRVCPRNTNRNFISE